MHKPRCCEFQKKNAALSHKNRLCPTPFPLSTFGSFWDRSPFRQIKKLDGRVRHAHRARALKTELGKVQSITDISALDRYAVGLAEEAAMGPAVFDSWCDRLRNTRRFGGGAYMRG